MQFIESRKKQGKYFRIFSIASVSILMDFMGTPCPSLPRNQHMNKVSLSNTEVNLQNFIPMNY